MGEAGEGALAGAGDYRREACSRLPVARGRLRPVDVAVQGRHVAPQLGADAGAPPEGSLPEALGRPPLDPKEGQGLGHRVGALG